MRIEVTQEDIDRGKRWSNCTCPIALAAQRACPGVGISVDDASILIDSQWSYLPDEAQEFVHEFDRGATVEPFAFTIDLPGSVE